MRRDLPSPTALLAFEACARQLSFKDAAVELNVSPAAVSRQIRNLEDYIGQPLFHRLHRGVELSVAGERLFEPVNQGFAGMAAALASLKSVEGDHQVTIGTTVGFAFYWLMPRLARFSEAWPEVTLNQIVTDEPISFSDSQVDLAVRYGTGQWMGQECRYLFSDRIYPVCSPSFLAASGTPSVIADLADKPLIESHGIPGDHWLDWTTWFRYVGHRAVGIRTRYLNYLIGVQMALNGQGYALGWHSFVGDLVASGQLVKPLDVEVSSPGAFFMTTPTGRPLGVDAALFADWLVAEATD
jgi:LysR family glycine cleavage system transcriptional activator